MAQRAWDLPQGHPDAPSHSLFPAADEAVTGTPGGLGWEFGLQSHSRTLLAKMPGLAGGGGLTSRRPLLDSPEDSRRDPDLILVPLKALGRQSGLQGSQHSPSDPAAFSCPVASAPANCRAVSGTSRPGLSDLVFLVALALPLSYPSSLRSLPACPDLPSHACPTAGAPSRPARPDPQSSLEPWGGAGQCCPLPGCRALGKKCFLALAGQTDHGEAQPRVPRVCSPRAPGGPGTGSQSVE